MGRRAFQIRPPSAPDDEYFKYDQLSAPDDEYFKYDQLSAPEVLDHTT